ncbi:MerR family transcriptional regulator [Halobacteriovorax sp. GB3]|uniref:MerR family transcriptional regulator n=1 Tax=Halobacteriovorax sp. GB3 TaxID=2719615 RepID=UPI00235F5B2F|nr:MerR family transcriptional regulator [Halobacteriovorax sp. GB3]MDD0851503.1 MerR family transcriptional regulator [Halobacteriovorax sp. GB3]
MSKYPIQIASKLSGVGVHTLRAWEKRYSAVVPSRNDSGRRLYSDDDIEKLKLLSDLCSLGNNIGAIANKNISELKEILKKLGKQDFDESPKVNEVKGQDIQDALKNLILALEFYKLDVISHEIKKIMITMNPKDFALKILMPLLQEVGIRVERGTFSIAQEHALSSILKFHIGHLIYKSYQTRRKKNALVLLTTPENEMHEFGIMMASLLCCHHGVNFYYLGPNLPPEALGDAASSLEADAVILGTTVVTAMNTDLNDYLERTLRHIGKKTSLWVGGNGDFDIDSFLRSKRFRYLPTINQLDRILADLI